MSGFGICILTVPNNDIGNAYPTALPFGKSSTVQFRHLNRSARVISIVQNFEPYSEVSHPSKSDSGAIISTVLFFRAHV